MRTRDHVAIVAPLKTRPLLQTAIILGVLCLPVVLDAGAVTRGAAVSAHPLLRYLWIPIVVVSACALVLTPGLLVVQALRAADNAGDWILRALALSILGISAAATLVQTAIGHALTGIEFMLVLAALTFGALAAGLLAGRSGAQVPMAPGDDTVIISLLVAPLVLAAALAPKFLVESFNGDGAHAFEATRRLLYSASPFFPPEAGGIAGYPSFKTVLPSYVMSFFVRLFGEHEAGLRFPYLLVLGGVFAGIASLLPRDRDTLRTDRWLVWAGLAVFTVVIGFSGSYELYHADVALPGIADALTIAMMLGMIAACVQRRPVWIAVFTVLLYTTTPAGALVAGFWLIAMILALRPFQWREAAIVTGAVAACVIIERVLPGAMRAIGLPGPGTEHSTGSLAGRLLQVQWRDWRRLLYFVIPCGILPAVMLLAWRRQDRLSRALTLLALAVFGFFYVQDRFALHYFSPAWVLPLVVCWRAAPAGSRAFRIAALVLAAASLIISLPPDTRAWTATREVGEAIEDRGSGYREGEPSAFARGALLSKLFPSPANAKVPDEAYGSSPIAWQYYAERRDRSARAAYVLQAPGDPDPAGGILVERTAAGALFVMDSTRYARHQAIRPDGGGGVARIYRISKFTLFGQ